MTDIAFSFLAVSQGKRTRLRAPGGGLEGMQVVRFRGKAGFYSRASRAGAASESVSGDREATQQDRGRTVVSLLKTRA